jgi:copper chaperone CopZ
MAKPLIKKRKIVVAGIKDQESVDKIKEYLNKKTGVIAVDVESQKGFVRVEYDLRQINFETIEKSIIELGFSFSKKVSEKFKRGMTKFTEQNELDNLNATPSSCCEDPKEKNPRL